MKNVNTQRTKAAKADMEEQYKTAIRDLLGTISNDEYLKKIYTITLYYANQETLENIGGTAE